MNRLRSLAVAMSAVALLITGCESSTIQGTAVSPLYDGFRAGGLPTEDGPSGVRDDAPAPKGKVANTDEGKIDELALLAINDVAEFWEKHYSESLEGTFEPLEQLISWDSTERANTAVCGSPTFGYRNALYCPPSNSMAWDRGFLVPMGKKFFGDAAVAALFAHEYGHAVQYMGKLVDQTTATIVKEQQADCFAGTYIRWMAEGASPRLQVSTGDGLNHVLAGVITGRDSTESPLSPNYARQEHGSALDRVSAFQMGFTEGAAECVTIDVDEIKKRRGALSLIPEVQDGEIQSGNVAVTEEFLSSVMDTLGAIYKLKNPPELSFDNPTCDDVKPSSPAFYCPSSNTIFANLSALGDLGTPADKEDEMLIKGDNTAISALTSRYALAVQHEKGEPLDNPAAALRTACITGVAQFAMVQPVELPNGGTGVTLTAGDYDEAVASLLTTGFVASDVNAEGVPSGFTRIVAYRTGLAGDEDDCYENFK